MRYVRSARPYVDATRPIAREEADAVGLVSCANAPARTTAPPTA